MSNNNEENSTSDTSTANTIDPRKMLMYTNLKGFIKIWEKANTKIKKNDEELLRDILICIIYRVHFFLIDACNVDSGSIFLPDYMSKTDKNDVDKIIQNMKEGKKIFIIIRSYSSSWYSNQEAIGDCMIIDGDFNSIKNQFEEICNNIKYFGCEFTIKYISGAFTV